MAQYDLTTEDGILDWLRSSEYGEGKSVTSVERLPGGASGFVYRGTLQNAFRASVIVKHVENYAARAQHWKLDPSRMVDCLYVMARGLIENLTHCRTSNTKR